MGKHPIDRQFVLVITPETFQVFDHNNNERTQITQCLVVLGLFIVVVVEQVGTCAGNSSLVQHACSQNTIKAAKYSRFARAKPRSIVSKSF